MKTNHEMHMTHGRVGRALRIDRAMSSTRAVLFSVGLAAFGIASAARADVQSDIDALWKDPTFLKQFVGGYGINSDIEPRLSPDEVKLLEKLAPSMANNLPEAEATLKKAMKPESSALLDFNLGSIQFQQGRMSDALASYSKAVEKFPSFRRAWRNLGLLYVRDSKFDEAINAYTRMIELGGGDGASFGYLAYAYAGKQDFQAAEVAFRNALLLQPEKLDWRFGLTNCALRQQKYEDAVTLLDGLIERFPDKAEYWVKQASAYLNMKQPLKAAQNFEVVDFLGKSTVDSLSTLGDIYLSENLPDTATRSYLRAIDLDTKQPLARPLRSAEALAQRGALPQARQISMHIRAAMGQQLEEGDRRKLLKLEARLSMAEGIGTNETAAVLEEIVKLDPLDGEALMMLGQHYSKLNEPDRAIFYYERAGSVEAFEVRAKLSQARLLVGMARYAEAVPLIRRAQELKPREDIARYLEQVERFAKAKR